MCPRKVVYPFNQPVVSKAATCTHKSVMSTSDVCEQVASNKGSTSEVDDITQCVDKYKAPGEAVKSASDKCDQATSFEVSTSEVDDTTCMDRYIASDGPVKSTSDKGDQLTSFLVSTSGVDGQQCVDEYKGPGEGNDTVMLDSLDRNLEEPGWENDINKFWEVEVDSPSTQITEVQGQLRKNLSFWREVLHAPNPVLECIENGYHLPLKFLPPPHCQNITDPQRLTASL